MPGRQRLDGQSQEHGILKQPQAARPWRSAVTRWLLRQQGSQTPLLRVFVSSLLSSLYMRVFTHCASQTALILSDTPLSLDHSVITPPPSGCSSDSQICHDSDTSLYLKCFPPSHAYTTLLFNWNSLHDVASVVKHGSPQNFPSRLCFHIKSNST